MLTSKQVLSIFLEKDNLKMVVTSGLGKGATRLYGGQLSFAPEVVHDAFIVDGSKFSSQVKIAVSQKPQLQKPADVQLVLPPEKTFMRTLDPSENVEAFLQVLPYFKEELILQTVCEGEGKPITHVAYERKLVEELQQPFLDLGKVVVKITGVAPLIFSSLAASGDYFLLTVLEKTISVIVVRSGKAVALETWSPEFFADRFAEYIRNNSFENIKSVQTVGVLDPGLMQNLSTSLGLVFSSKVTGDIYDLLISLSGGKTKFTFPKLAFPALALPVVTLPRIDKRFLGAGILAAGVVVVGLGIIGNLQSGPVVKPVNNAVIETAGGIPEVKSEGTGSAVSPTPTPVSSEPVVIALTPQDFKVRVLNGTKVEGEAGKLAGTLKGQGFVIIETKNATNSSFLATRLRVTDTVPEKIVSDLQTTLLKTYEDVVVEKLEDTKANIEIIIGRKI